MSISRRGFMKGAALGTLACSTAKAGSTKHFAGYPERNGLLHDTTLCVGCRSCEQACNQVNQLAPIKEPIGDTSVFTAKREVSQNLYTVVNRYQAKQGNQPAVYRKHQCMHCNEPCCASVCFVKAFVKTPEGPVLYNPDLCVGCRYCVFACPYYALAYEYEDPATPRVVRCTMCYPRIKKGLQPACAESCPTGAIVFGKRDKIIRLARERIRKFPDRYIDHIFGEHEYGGASWLTLAGISFQKLGLPEGLSHDPLPKLTTGFLSLAPLVAAIFPGLLAGIHAFTKRKEKLNEAEKRTVILKERDRARQRAERPSSLSNRALETSKAGAGSDKPKHDETGARKEGSL